MASCPKVLAILGQVQAIVTTWNLNSLICTLVRGTREIVHTKVLAWIAMLRDWGNLSIQNHRCPLLLIQVDHTQAKATFSNANNADWEADIFLLGQDQSQPRGSWVDNCCLVAGQSIYWEEDIAISRVERRPETASTAYSQREEREEGRRGVPPAEVAGRSSSSLCTATIGGRVC